MLTSQGKKQTLVVKTAKQIKSSRIWIHTSDYMCVSRIHVYPGTSGYTYWLNTKASSIIKDFTHLRHRMFVPLPSWKRYRLSSPMQIEWSAASFPVSTITPQSSTLYNMPLMLYTVYYSIFFIFSLFKFLSILSIYLLVTIAMLDMFFLLTYTFLG